LIALIRDCNLGADSVRSLLSKIPNNDQNIRNHYFPIRTTSIRVSSFRSEAKLGGTRSRLNTMASVSTPKLPLLLPNTFQPHPEAQSSLEWKPSKYLAPPLPPPLDDAKQHDQEMAQARQLIDGKAIKKVRPRRTIDYFAGMGRWALVCCSVQFRVLLLTRFQVAKNCS